MKTSEIVEDYQRGSLKRVVGRRLDAKIQSEILRVLAKMKRPIGPRRLDSELRNFRPFDIRRGIWNLAADGKLELTRTWKLKICPP